MKDELTNTATEKDQPCGISFRLLGSLMVAFLLGCATYGLVQNFSSAPPLSFSTPALIGFVLSVLLAGASIVMSITAIMLGKFSERAMITRSDESIRLQNEVFQKTTDALQRIESSTGVTEKRIEDIISGRVGDLSHKIAEIATEKQEGRGRLSPQDVEEMIKRTLLQSIGQEDRPSSRAKREEEIKRRIEVEEKRKEDQRVREKEYQELHMRTLRAFSCLDGLKALKMHHGNVTMSGDDLFDGIFLRPDGKRLSVTTFSRTHELASLRDFSTNALLELRKGTIEHVYAVLYETNEEQEKSFNDAVSVSASDLASRMTLLVCPPDKIEEIIGMIQIANKTPEGIRQPADGLPKPSA